MLRRLRETYPLAVLCATRPASIDPGAAQSDLSSCARLFGDRQNAFIDQLHRSVRSERFDRDRATARHG